MKSMKTWRAASVACECVAACVMLWGCAYVPSAPPGEPAGAARLSPTAEQFERRQRERARAAERQGRLAEAAQAWEVLAVLRPDAAEYRERLASTRRQIDAAVDLHLQRAALAMKGGDFDAAGAQCLTALALEPGNAQAAEALRAIERERNRRNYLGKPSRLTMTRRAWAEAEMASAQPRGKVRSNDLELASMLAAQGELDDAIAVLEARLAVDKRDAAARSLLAEVYYQRADRLAVSDRAGAIAALEKSLKLNSTNPRAMERLKSLKSAQAVPVQGLR